MGYDSFNSIAKAYLTMVHRRIYESSTSYIISSDEDLKYMKAVEVGDMDAASRMVREAAAKAFPNTNVVDEDGMPKIVYHGTSSYGFTKFVPTKSLRDVGIHFGSKYLADSVSTHRHAKGRIGITPGVYACFLNITNMATVEDEFQMSNKEFADMFSGQNGYDALKAKTAEGKKIQERIEEKWHYWLEKDEDSCEPDIELKQLVIDLLKVERIDGLYYFNANESDEYDYVALNPSQIKLADSVTYDNAGNIIPLSRRFDNGDDIRGAV